MKQQTMEQLFENARLWCRCTCIAVAAALPAQAQDGGSGSGKTTAAPDVAVTDAALGGLKTLKGFNGKQWTNSLGMRFAPVPPTRVAFSIWETRVRDYEAFATATNADASWKDPGFEQTPDHPVVNVSWEDARAFCKWLTDKERAAGVIGPGMAYRLPTDEEWSTAVGLPAEQGRAPMEKDGKIDDVFPWGAQWPPPQDAGNYAVDGVDQFRRIAPVGSFAANKFGLHDLGGNVWEWCEDAWLGKSGARVLRGGSWGNRIRAHLLSSNRDRIAPGERSTFNGFRCVLVVAGE